MTESPQAAEDAPLPATTAITSSADDWRPLLITRAWPRPSIEANFDDWQARKHLPDLVQAPGLAEAAYFRALLEGLPEAWKGSGTRMAWYIGHDLTGLWAWLRSDELRTAIEDGSQWFGGFNDVDFAPYTGNVCVVTAVGAGRSGLASPRFPVAVERFEVPDGAPRDAFDQWLINEHLAAFRECAGVMRVRCFEAVRDEVPVPYYLSPGNRMVVADLDPDAHVGSTLLDGPIMEALADSLRWDLNLPYVKRDVYECLTVAVRDEHPIGSAS